MQYYKNIIGNLGYGNGIADGSYFSGNFSGQSDKSVCAKEPCEDNAYLENLLGQFDGEKRKEIIEVLIRDRDSLKRKMLSEIEDIKDHLRTVNYVNRYRVDSQMPFKDLAKLYSGLNYKRIEQEINAWKDISFLRLKLFDEGLAGGNYENEQV